MGYPKTRKALPCVFLLVGISKIATAQLIPCPDFGKDLLKIPEINRDATRHRLRGVITLADEKRLLWFTSSAPPNCAPQLMRYFVGHAQGAAGEKPPMAENLPEPLPGPTLRARVGDTIEITFLNQIDPQDFGASIDRGEQGLGCDEVKNGQTQIYPGPAGGPDAPADSMPNCFHGSSTANLHYHGTHTTPDTTGDNVLLQIRPSPRDSAGKPRLTEAAIRPIFDEVFRRCEEHGSAKRWEDLPSSYRSTQEALLKQYDATAPYRGGHGLPPDQQLWPANARAIQAGVWPQYFIGAYPYCFSLPEYKENGNAPQNPEMGQSPGTHWYHAHKHGSTALNVSNGMTGAFIIEGDYDDKLRDFYKTTPEHQNWGLEEQVLMIQQLFVTPNMERAKSSGPNGLSVNGRQQPVLTMRPNQVQMWRIINGAPRDLVTFVPFSNGIEWRQTAQDGVQYAFENYHKQENENAGFSMASANRVDLLVKAPAKEGDYQLQVYAGLVAAPGPNDKTSTLLTVRVKNDPARPVNPPMDFIHDRADFPKPPKYLDDINPAAIHIRRDLVFDTQPPGNPFPPSQHTINGKKFSDHTIYQTMVLGDAEEWTLLNSTAKIEHPFHIHVNPFQVIEVFNPNNENTSDPTKPCYVDPAKPATWVPCKKLEGPFIWWDTISIPNAKVVNNVTIPGRIVFRSRFTDFTGTYVLHCHILAHEDRGMMEMVQVVPNMTPLGHH